MVTFVGSCELSVTCKGRRASIDLYTGQDTCFADYRYMRSRDPNQTVPNASPIC